MTKSQNIIGKVDWTTVLIYFVLVIIGWFNIYASGYDENHSSILDFSQKYGKQIIWILSSFIIAFFVLITDARFFNQFAYLLYFLSILILIFVLFKGSETAGSKSWLIIYKDIKVQPAELAKVTTSLAIAKFLGTINVNIEDLKTKLITFFLILLPAALIVLEKETGSALVFVAFIFVLFREGLSGNILITIFLLVILFILSLVMNKFILIALILFLALILFMFIRRKRKEIITLVSVVCISISFILSVEYIVTKVLEPHQQKRIYVLLGKETDVKGAGYNVNQSMIAIGSGGLWGKGFLQGTQTKFNFVPEQSTDFIFCTIGEEWGFIGSIVILALYVYLILRILLIAERQKSVFSRIYGYSVASILFFHFMINIGMTIGLAPVVGIPLPFLSYGGSSMWGFSLLLFIFIKQDAARLQTI
ncbi:MAG TPA: rod shape-determining protein RodA [Bacteroidales bacterium]|nr:rod shape-determining protein RodA [Bacteroidales bacterium]